MKVVVVDERPGMGLGAELAALPSVRVCAEAGTAAEAMEALESAHPDLLIVDVSLPRLGGLNLVRAARRLHPKVPVVAVAPDDARAAAAMKAGARAFLLREGAAEGFLAAAAAAQAGKKSLDPRPAAARPRRGAASVTD